MSGETLTPDGLPPLRQFIKKILPDVDGVLALRKGPSRIVSPYLFVKEHPEELAKLVFWPLQPIPEALDVILRAHPDANLFIVCRGCEESSIVDVFNRARLSMDNVNFITLQCKPSEIEYCECDLPFTWLRQDSGWPAQSRLSQSAYIGNCIHKSGLKMRMN